MDEMKRIVICKHCGKPEYYGEMRWLSGICSCRNCYKGQWERENHKMYIWEDLDGKKTHYGRISKARKRGQRQ